MIQNNFENYPMVRVRHKKSTICKMKLGFTSQYNSRVVLLNNNELTTEKKYPYSISIQHYY